MNNLRTYRERKGLSQMELGNSVGLSDAAVSMIERGLKDTNGEKWKLIAKLLECSLDELLGE